MTVLLRPGPTAWPLRVTAMRPPEAGYSAMVPDTWYRQQFAPEVSDLHRIRTANTGWGPIWESGINIGTGRTVKVRRALHDRSTPAFGHTFKRTEIVESGNGFPVVEQELEKQAAQEQEEADDAALWCCDSLYFWETCSAYKCWLMDMEAATEAAEDAGGGVVLDHAGTPIAVVVEDDTGTTHTVTTAKHGKEAVTTAAKAVTPQLFEEDEPGTQEGGPIPGVIVANPGSGKVYAKQRFGMPGTTSRRALWLLAAGASAAGAYYLWQRTR